jgi:hypothetical protein
MTFTMSLTLFSIGLFRLVGKDLGYEYRSRQSPRPDRSFADR